MPSPSSPPSPTPPPRKTRVSSINLHVPAPSPDADVHHRGFWLPPSRKEKDDFGQTLPTTVPMGSIQYSTPSASSAGSPTGLAPPAGDSNAPTICGMPLKYVSLLTLAFQNALLTVIMHYSRVSTAPSQTYSAASAVLVNELLKGAISLVIAVARIDADMLRVAAADTTPPLAKGKKLSFHGLNGGPPVSAAVDSALIPRVIALLSPARWATRLRRLRHDVFSADCWKLSIPAILYVVQNNLQFVAASNLDVATFQVTYQMKILTTAAFSVFLLRRKLSPMKWLALFFLALGVGIVQIQSGKPAAAPVAAPHAGGEAAHVMHPPTGFLAVCAACMTSGLAGVYFEMVLKGSPADLWIRNVQLSLFSLVPALVPVLFNTARYPPGFTLFRNFTPWAWATVLTQVAGGLVTAIVIKHADNILKGFATSLSIILSFLASVALFGFAITPAFLLGASTVLASTWMYNQPAPAPGDAPSSLASSLLSPPSPSASRRPSFPGSPIGPDAPILGQPKQRSPYTSPSSIAIALGLTSASTSVGTSTLPSPVERDYFSGPGPAPLYPPPNPFHTPPSRPPSRPPTRPPSARPSLNLPSGPDGDLQAIDLGPVPRPPGR